MKTLSQSQLNKAETYINKNARPLDITLFDYYFNNGKAETVLSELQEFQNEDGGFGYGLEPDFSTPLSSNMATTYAFQYFNKLKTATLPSFLKNAISFFENSYSEKYKMWLSIPEESDKSPHAIWWNYDLEKIVKDENWGNPTVEIIGYLLQYDNNFDQSVLIGLKNVAIKRILDSDEVEIHELMCYQRFVKGLKKEEQELVNEKIIRLAVKQVERDSSKWNSYVPRPLNLVDSPTSPVYPVLETEVQKELDYLIETLNSDGAWLPNWEWHQYNDEWEKIKPQITGVVTVRNLITLKEFNRV